MKVDMGNTRVLADGRHEWKGRAFFESLRGSLSRLDIALQLLEQSDFRMVNDPKPMPTIDGRVKFALEVSMDRPAFTAFETMIRMAGAL